MINICVWCLSVKAHYRLVLLCLTFDLLNRNISCCIKILNTVYEIILVLAVDVLCCQGEPASLQKCLRETAKDLVHND